MGSGRPADRRCYWDNWFAHGEDPWGYDSAYEATKYRQTLELLPATPIATALELGCAEGHFTAQLAPRVGRLIGSDISATALQRAAGRCGRLSNIEYRQIDFVSDPLPQDLDLLVCSESLYYVERDQLPALADKFAAALSPGGHLLMAHATAIADQRDRTGFDWGAPFGVETIGRVFDAAEALTLVKELRTPLYRIQLFRRMAPGTLRPGLPEVIEAEPGALPPRVASLVIWDGAVRTRAEAQRERASDIPILMYHSIADHGPPELRPYRLAPAAFQEQLRFLRRHGYHSISLDEWARCIADRSPLPGRPVIITFDDGYKDFFTTAAPLLEAAGFRATVFVVTDKTGGVADWDTVSGPSVELMSWDDLRSLEARGFSIGSHTTSHVDLTTLSDDEIVHDSGAARAALSRELGHDIDRIAFPWGRSDARVRAALARGGYRTGVEVSPRRSALSDDIGCLPRIEILRDDDIETFAGKLRASAAMTSAPEPQPAAVTETAAKPAGARRNRQADTMMTPEYARTLASRVDAMVDALLALRADLLTAVAPPQSVQRRLDALFNMPITGEKPETVTPHQEICPSWRLSFEPPASVTIEVRPKQTYAASPNSCCSSIEIEFSGTSRWLALETPISWSEVAGCERFQLSFNGEPNRVLQIYVGLRSFLRDGGYHDHIFGSLQLSPQRCVAVAADALKLPDLAPVDVEHSPTLLIFLADPKEGLRVRLDYINLYFA